MQRRIRHRGPDEGGTAVLEYNGKYNVLCHERLSINELSLDGVQPWNSPFNEDIIIIFNGEIYNFPDIRKKYEGKYEFKGNCDIQAIAVLWEEYGKDLCQYMDGMYGFVVYNKKTGDFLVARDHAGIIPVYLGKGKLGEKYLANELKAISEECEEVKLLGPGCYVTNDWKQTRWYNPAWRTTVPKNPCNFKEFRDHLTDAVKAHLMADVPFGLIISGGIDSSLVASIAMRLVREGVINIEEKGMKHVPSFCIGLKDSPDVQAARKVAQTLGTKHYEFIYTIDEGIDHIPEVIYHLETYNPTTIRSGTPMYLLARKIKAMGIKMILTGEGADDLLAGYLYFHKAPDSDAIHEELVRKIDELHRHDLLRVNKASMAWGLEVRVPFLHKPFIDYAMSIDPKEKHPKANPRAIEKYILREAFDVPEDPYLPEEILWRQKEQFGDGVGYRWTEGIQDHVNKIIPDDIYNMRKRIFALNTPTSKEMFWFRTTFEKYFPNDECVKTVPFYKSIACSTDYALEWDDSFKENPDESGRSVLGIHKSGRTASGTL
jgi:asparagine synthase (glutamine-hydrolysing)